MTTPFQRFWLTRSASPTPSALALLSEGYRLVLKIFYLAAVFLQRAYHNEILPLLAEDWRWLPELLGQELGLSLELSPEDGIQRLGIRHQELTHSFINCAGTDKNIAHRLIRYRQRELQ